MADLKLDENKIDDSKMEQSNNDNINIDNNDDINDNENDINGNMNDKEINNASNIHDLFEKPNKNEGVDSRYEGDILIPYFGLKGAAYATVLTYLIIIFFLDCFSKHTREILKIKMRSILKI